MPTWQSVQFSLQTADADTIADEFLALGAISATITDAAANSAQEQPLFGEPGEDLAPRWTTAEFNVLFSEDTVVADIMRTVFTDGPLPAYHIEAVADTNWVLQSQAQFQPLSISERLWIVPTWHTPPVADAINIMLDPGMAFGSGAHPTTQMCLRWLEAVIKPGVSLLDYGCGSGILAIAAAKFGAGAVYGIDIDPDAIDAAAKNATANAVHLHLALADTPLNSTNDNQQTNIGAQNSEAMPRQFDIVVANILANPLRLLAPLLCHRIKAGGRLAIAGLLVSQADELIECYRPWLTLTPYATEETWVCLEGTLGSEALTL